MTNSLSLSSRMLLSLAMFLESFGGCFGGCFGTSSGTEGPPLVKLPRDTLCLLFCVAFSLPDEATSQR